MQVKLGVTTKQILDITQFVADKLLAGETFRVRLSRDGATNDTFYGNLSSFNVNGILYVGFEIYTLDEIKPSECINLASSYSITAIKANLNSDDIKRLAKGLLALQYELQQTGTRINKTYEFYIKDHVNGKLQSVDKFFEEHFGKHFVVACDKNSIEIELMQLFDRSFAAGIRPKIIEQMNSGNGIRILFSDVERSVMATLFFENGRLILKIRGIDEALANKEFFFDSNNSKSSLSYITVKPLLNGIEVFFDSTFLSSYVDNMSIDLEKLGNVSLSDFKRILKQRKDADDERAIEQISSAKPTGHDDEADAILYMPEHGTGIGLLKAVRMSNEATNESEKEDIRVSARSLVVANNGGELLTEIAWKVFNGQTARITFGEDEQSNNFDLMHLKIYRHNAAFTFEEPMIRFEIQQREETPRELYARNRTEKSSELAKDLKANFSEYEFKMLMEAVWALVSSFENGLGVKPNVLDIGTIAEIENAFYSCCNEKGKTQVFVSAKSLLENRSSGSEKLERLAESIATNELKALLTFGDNEDDEFLVLNIFRAENDGEPDEQINIELLYEDIENNLGKEDEYIEEVVKRLAVGYSELNFRALLQCIDEFKKVFEAKYDLRVTTYDLNMLNKIEAGFKDKLLLEATKAECESTITNCYENGCSMTFETDTSDGGSVVVCVIPTDEDLLFTEGTFAIQMDEEEFRLSFGDEFIDKFACEDFDSSKFPELFYLIKASSPLIVRIKNGVSAKNSLSFKPDFAKLTEANELVALGNDEVVGILFTSLETGLTFGLKSNVKFLDNVAFIETDKSGIVKDIAEKDNRSIKDIGRFVRIPLD